jgi:hypothetical protein
MSTTTTTAKRRRRPSDADWIVTTRAKKPRKSPLVGPSLPTLPVELRQLIWQSLGPVGAARLSQVCHRLSIEMRPYRVPRSWLSPAVYRVSVETRAHVFERAMALGSLLIGKATKAFTQVYLRGPEFVLLLYFYGTFRINVWSHQVFVYRRDYSLTTGWRRLLPLADALAEVRRVLH